MSLAITNEARAATCPQSGAANRFTPRCWEGRLLLLVLVLGPAWLLDTPLAERSPRQYRISFVENFRDTARQFGEPYCAFWLALTIWFLDPSRRRPIVLTLVGLLAAGMFANGLKLAIGRERPVVSDGRTVLRGPHWPGTMRPDASFPSGHTASAFALAYGMSRMFPRGLKVLVFLAAACGVSRVLGDTHFLTDVLAGAWVGWESARAVWEWGFWKPVRWIDSKIPEFTWYSRWNWESPAPR